MNSPPVSVLVVEDDEDHAVLIEKQLSRIAVVGDIQRVVNGDDAISLFSQTQYKPDLILLDLNLPRYSGYEVLAALRAEEATSRTPVVVVTSSPNDDHAERAKQYNVMDVVVKPATGERIAEILHELRSTRPEQEEWS